MNIDSSDPQSTAELTPEEKRFIVKTLQQVELRGNAEALRQAVELIDSVVRKLSLNDAKDVGLNS